MLLQAHTLTVLLSIARFVSKIKKDDGQNLESRGLSLRSRDTYDRPIACLSTFRIREPQECGSRKDGQKRNLVTKEHGTHHGFQETGTDVD